MAMRIAFFIDAANMFYAQRELQWNIDYKKLYEYFSQNKEVYNAFYYTGTKGSELERGFHRKLTFLGYTVRTKNVKKIKAKGGSFSEKCNLDIEIVIDMLNTSTHYDQAMVFSGDSDFERALELLRSKGKTITVVSTKGMISWNLLNAADNFIDLKDIRQDIERIEKNSAPP